MNEWAIIAVLAGAVSVCIGYVIGMESGRKDIRIREVEIERDMYKQRLQEWKSKE